MPINFKICCMQSIEEMHMAVRYGANAVGLVGAMPSGPGPIPDQLARDIARAAPANLDTFLLTSRQTARDIAAHIKFCEPKTVQIVNHVEPSVHAELAELTNVKRVQVIHVEDTGALELARAYESCVDALLLDSGRPHADTIELGGTGRVHDWSISARIVAQVDVPVYLAGGLNPDNVAQAIQSVRPFGVDLCSGIRREDRLVEEELARFSDKVFENTSNT